MVHVQVVDEFLKRHGNEDGGSYFLGGTYSAAETLTTPWLVRSLVSLPATRDVDVLAIAEEKGLDRFVRWVKVRRKSLLSDCVTASAEVVVHMLKLGSLGYLLSGGVLRRRQAWSASQT